MKLQILQDLNKHGPPPSISFKPYPTIGKKSDKKQALIKVDIKSQLGDINIETVSFYTLIFKTGSTEALLRFLILLKKIPNSQNLTTGLRHMLQ